MATYGTDLTTLADGDGSDSGTWTEFTNYALGGTPAADGENFIQGIDCISQTTGTKTGLNLSIAYNVGSDISGSLSAGDVILSWLFYAVGSNLETYSNGGWRYGIGSDASSLNIYTVGGSDYGRNPYGGWQNVAVDPTRSADYTDNGGNGGAYQYFGSIPYTLNAISKGTPHGMDAIRYGRGEIYCTGTGCDFVGMAQYNDYNDGTNGYNRFGLFSYQQGVYLWKGLMSIGQSGTSATFSDSNKTVIIDDAAKTYLAFNRIEVNNSSTSLTWNNISFKALGTVSPGQLEIIDDADVNIEGCTFLDMDTFVFLSNSNVIGSKFQRCKNIDSGGGVFTGTEVLESSVAADASAFTWDVNVDPDGYLDEMSFSLGANAHHAIEFGTTSPTSMTITGVDFSGFNASNGQNDSTLYFARTTGAVTLNLSGCSGTVSYKSAGATITLVADQVSHTLTGLVNGSEVTYVKRGTAVDTGSDGSTTTGSRNFVTTNSWTPDAYKGHILEVTSGADAGRYYVSGNSATTLYLDTEMTATASSLNWELYDENDDTEVWHVESVTGGQSQYTYTYSSDVTVDIIIINTDYEQIVLEGIVLGNTSQSVPIVQIPDVNYYNP